jgi:NADP-dependent 3-hydroxy acid dehydrogenase YdfG
VTGIGESLRQELRQMHENHSIRVTLIEPGMTDTDFFESKPKIRALEAEDVARAVLYAVEQPEHVDVNEILIRPSAQPN